MDPRHHYIALSDSSNLDTDLKNPSIIILQYIHINPGATPEILTPSLFQAERANTSFPDTSLSLDAKNRWAADA